ncbi:solute carrier family 22 member 15-like [Diaphorina citri]|uniref:Solute carrier family 22 member 15-like n=1 Tax=Diaphorina citri TaxID=121845 RepID=A0A3Q0IP87_DIACI|nr:solute carrier family 22 member 15-like [Diaphorina citri]
MERLFVSPPASHPPPPSLLSLEEDTVAIARDKLLRQLNKCVQRECCRRKTLDELLVLLEQKRLTKNDVRNVFREICDNGTIRTRLVIMCYLWFATSISYYGVTFSVPALSGDRFQNFCYGAGFELVFFSVSFFVLSKIGRKKPLVAYFLSSSILFVCVFLLSLSRFHLSASVKTLLVLLGKGTIVGAFFCIFVYCAELFPTPMRAACSGMTSLCCRIGSLLSPYFITYSMKLSPDSMLLCIGVATFIAAILTFCLPETHRKKLPDTVADALNLNCDQEIKENRRS